MLLPHALDLGHFPEEWRGAHGFEVCISTQTITAVLLRYVKTAWAAHSFLSLNENRSHFIFSMALLSCDIALLR